MSEKMNVIFSVDLIEFERGWGSKVDDTLLFVDANQAFQYVEDFNSKNTEKTVPDWYMKAESPVRGTIEQDSYDVINQSPEKYMSSRKLRDTLMEKQKEKQNKRICNNCSKELKPPINGLPDWFVFKLSCENVAMVDTQDNGIHIEPPFLGTKHFCNKFCLIEFLSKL